jgi:general secretion pathway protein G
LITYPSQRCGRRPSVRGAFTLVEILIVVFILGILAALVIPQFTSAAATSRENSIKMDLHRLRVQIEIYIQQHDGKPPTLAEFTQQMTMANAQGQTAAVGTPGYTLGPYIQTVPVNPNTSTRDVGDGDVGTSAWYYNENTGEFRANDSAETRLY